MYHEGPLQTILRQMNLNTETIAMARILIVEDDGALRNDIGDTLMGWGHEVLMAADGRQGLKIIDAEHPDLVLSDINMPHETGVELVGHVKQRGSQYADISFLFISSLSAPNDVISGIRSGADDYIIKPINYDLLKVKIDAHLHKTRNLLSMLSVERIAISMAGSVTSGAMFVAVVGTLGVAVLIALYWIKTALGINVFQDAHVGDLFW